MQRRTGNHPAEEPDFFKECHMANRKAQPVELTIDTTSPEKVCTAILVVGAFADGSLPPSSRKIDEASKGKLSAIIKRGDLGDKPGSTLVLHDLPGVEADRVLLVSLGKRDAFGDKGFREALKGAAKVLADGVAK